MAACRRVYDSRYLQADCQEPESAPEPYAQQSSMGYFTNVALLARAEAHKVQLTEPVLCLRVTAAC